LYFLKEIRRGRHHDLGRIFPRKTSFEKATAVVDDDGFAVVERGHGWGGVSCTEELEFVTERIGAYLVSFALASQDPFEPHTSSQAKHFQIYSKTSSNKYISLRSTLPKTHSPSHHASWWSCHGSQHGDKT
jgi:hypothetical protein